MTPPLTHETIVAIATPMGVGGIGVVRVSGPCALTIAQALTNKPLPKTREASLRSFYSANGTIIDQGLLLMFPSPQSYTGEMVIECQIHGSPMALSLLLEACLANGARLAEPGEFTRRAFINGQLDLCTAESVADLIHASTQKAALSAAQSLTGAFSKTITLIQNEMIALRAKLEASLDFADEDIEFIHRDEAIQNIRTLIATIVTIKDRARQGMLLRDGVRCIIVGAPNVGKSSLLNALAEEEAAIVTDTPGTTRDAILRTISIHGIPFHMVDTAGLRATHDPIEQMGIARTHEHIRTAELLIHLQALNDDGSLMASAVLPSFPEWSPKIVTVVNKWDRYRSTTPCIDSALPISVKTQTGLNELKSLLVKACGGSTSQEHDTPFSARLRHLQALEGCQQDLQDALMLAQAPQSDTSLIAESLRLAHQNLQRITGKYDVEDLLGDIFGRFCIGK